MQRNVSIVFAAFMLLGAIPDAASAEPLAKEECDKLQAEQGALTSAGVHDQLVRGAEWGKANLSLLQLKNVERYIELEEQLSFRCGMAKLRASLPVGEEGGEQELDTKGNAVPARDRQGQPGEAQAKAKGKPVPKIVAPAKDKAAPPAKSRAKMVPAKGEAQPPAAKAASKAKAKVDDAYRPPAAKGPDADPFAGKPPDKRQ